MIRLLPDLPDNVLGAEAFGTVTAEDYDTVVTPAVEEYVREHERARVLLVLGPEFEGFAAGAAWDDAKLGMSRVKAWEKIAIVTDHASWRQTIKMFSVVIPGEVKTFSLAELADAKAWVAE
jgi:hypothetical protein